MKLLTLKSAKMDKSATYGYLSAVLHLNPHAKIWDTNTCPWAGECVRTCLDSCGRMRLQNAIDARNERMELLDKDPFRFATMLSVELWHHSRKARSLGFKPSARLNGTSDLPWHKIKHFKHLFDMYPEIQFIDYTKDPDRCFETLPSNYHITYSINEKTDPELIYKIYSRTRFNCAAVFRDELPKLYSPNSFDKYRVYNGDKSDLRHLDPRGYIVGLKYKMAFNKRTGKKLQVKENGFIQIGR